MNDAAAGAGPVGRLLIGEEETMQAETDIGRADLERRLQELKLELATGQAQLASLDQKRRETSETMLRIVGAIQVLEELLQSTAGAMSSTSSSFGEGKTVVHAANGLQPAAEG